MTLDENDYLTYQLYTASKTPRIRNARIRDWVLTTLAFLCMAYLFFENNNDLLGYYFLIFAVLNIILYPVYSRWRYRRHYKKHIADVYKNRFGEECSLEMNEDFILTKDRTGEVKINTAEVEEINELKDLYFVKIRTGESLIISKQKTNEQELEVLTAKLMELVEKNGIKHNVELNWKWR